MPSDLHDDDEDLYGMPKRRPDTLYNFSFRRLKGWLPLVGIVGLLLLYWKQPWPRSHAVRWSRYAYSLYATDEHNLCNALMVFESLQKAGSKADRVLLHNPQWSTTAQGGRGRNSELLTMAAKRLRVKLRPVQLLDERGDMPSGLDEGQPSSGDTSITKLRAFELTEYDRVLHLDSDITLLQNLDDLFLLPKSAVAMPRAYWTDSTPDQWPFTSLLVLLEPSPDDMHRMIDTLRSWRLDPGYTGGNKYDMDLLNWRFGSSAMPLPHRPYALLSAEFRRRDHSAYLSTSDTPQSQQAEWNADAMLEEAKLVHFSDWPLPKPWMMWPHEGLVEIQPNCTTLGDGDYRYSCREREIWKELYDDFRRRRKNLCRILSVQAPDWRKWKQAVGAS